MFSWQNYFTSKLFNMVLFAVTCKDLQDVQLSLFLPTARMLLTVTQASPAACRQVVTMVSLKQFVLDVATCRVQHFDVHRAVHHNIFP
jgi:hypothetical protein